jgi:hypothetical protein
MRRLKAAWPEHLKSVRARVMDHLDNLDTDALLATLDAIVEAAQRGSDRSRPAR